MYDYQQEIVEFVKENPRAAVWVDMGLGKTVGVGTALADLIAEFRSNKTLIIAPKQVAESTWPEELAKWEQLKHLRYYNMTGKPEKERARMARQTNADVWLINVENFVWLHKLFKLGEFPWDTIILDESSLYKNYSAKRTKAMLRRVPEVQRIIEMTGTPAPKGLKQIFCQIRMLDDPKNTTSYRLGRTFGAFASMYFNKTGYMGKELELKDGAEEEIYDKIAEVVLRLDAKDYLDVEEPVHTPVYVPLPVKNLREYRKLEREYLLEIENEDESEANVVAFNSAALRQKLRQYAQGHVYAEEGGTLTVHDKKIKALDRLRDEMPGKNMIVVYHFKSDLERLKERYPHGVELKEKGAKERWDKGEIEMLFLHPASGGHGLNLQYGGHVMVWFTLTDNTENVTQTNGRLPRPGQEEVVMIYYLIAEGTVDEDIYAVNTGDIKNEREMLAAMKMRHKSL